MGFMANPNNSENIKYILNTDDVLKQIEDFLRGVRYDRQEAQYKQCTRPLLNDEGVSEIMRILDIRLSRVYSLSDLTDKEIYNITMVFAETLLDLLYGNRKKFGLEKINIRVMVHEISDSVYVTLKKAKDKGLQQFLKDTTQFTETNNLNNRAGITDIFKGVANKFK